MTNRRISLLTFTSAALLALLAPVFASAQTSRGPWWGRGGDYQRRVLRDAAQRIKNRSDNFQRHLDDRLDDSRYDDTRREASLNQLARNFRNAAARFEDRVDDRGDLNRSVGEARQVLTVAGQINRRLSRIRLDARTSSDWTQIRNDLRTVADIYGLRLSDFDGDGGRGRDDGYGRRNNGGSRWPY